MRALIDRRGFFRFLKYTSVGVSTFLFDLALIWVMTEFFAVSYVVATWSAFLVAVSINYALSRKFVFVGTERKVHHGYLYYIVLGVSGATAITSAVAFLVEVFGIPFMAARVAVAAIAGMSGYLFNLYINFRVAGREH